MATNIFSNIKNTADQSEKSFRWFQAQVKKLGDRVTPQQIMREGTNLRNNIAPGDMYLFMYDPKFKATLPYYDTFPLILPFNVVKDGFYGINLHYMPYMMRFKLLQALSELANNDKNDETTRIKISWSILNQFVRIAPIGACVKHYLNNHVKTRFLKINYPDWITASQLPIENFVGARKEVVWRDTRNKAI